MLRPICPSFIVYIIFIVIMAMEHTIYTRDSDETLFGLLSSYKFNNTYVRVLESPSDNCISVQVTDNPRKWSYIQDRKYTNFRELRRLEIGCDRLCLKYINHNQLLMARGPLLGIKIPSKNAAVVNKLENLDVHIFETTMEFREKILKGVKNLLNLSPQKKMEIIEKCINQCLRDQED
ncbi:MAG: hypothetical protein CVV44_15325 [Spirochaetae bacterium HGW-Spirochaetae-1]|jgi:hypothetical protein|nr:MAG: hypothetical protein CVV44_15325 [Spirochaetae bacterium HGW-Spirochaetae-1]